MGALREAELQRRNQELEDRLRESEQTLHALMSGEVDAVVDGGSSSPVLLRAAQASLRANEQLLRAIFDGAMDAMLIVDDRGRYVDANPAACELFGFTKEELIGLHAADFAAPGYAPKETWETFVAIGRMRGDFPLVRRDGSRRDLELSAVANVLPGLHLSVLRDVTDQRAAVAALREAELRFRRLFEAGIIGVTVTDASGSIREANDTFLGLVGYSREDLGGGLLSWGRLTADEHLPDLDRDHGDLAQLGSAGPREQEYLRKDATRVPVLVGAARLDHERVISVVIDLSARKRAEQRKAAVLSAALDAVVIMDASGSITEFNPAAERTFGYGRAEVLGRNLADVLIPQRHRQAHTDAVQRNVKTGAGERLARRIELTALRRDGTEFPVELSIGRVQSGMAPTFVGFIRDLTESHRSDSALRRTEEQLRQAQKMEAIGSLAGGVAHDFNNLLSVILSYTSLIIEDLQPSDPLRADLEEVHSAGVRATTLTRQLLAFSRRQVLEPTVLDLHSVVSGVEKMLARVVGDSVVLSLAPPASAGMVHADRGQIEQVLMNLVVNARDAMPGGGQITIETASTLLDEGRAREHPGVTPGPYVMLAVTDTGTGMDAATRERIFEPFFTTKDKSKGTGLGLATVYGIVQQSGGHIDVESELGKGTTFRVFLPRTDRDLARPTVDALPTSLRGTETILVVEDSDQVRNVVCTILRKHGYKVLEAQNGGEAFLMCEQLTSEIHLMLSDVVMPRMSGRQLSDRVASIRPEMRVLFMSGYTDDAISHQGILEGGIELLQKPITPDALTVRVRQVLDAPRVRPSTPS